MIDEIKITSLSGRGTLFLKNREYFGYWLGPVNWGQAEGKHQTYSYYNQVGESIVSTTINARSLSITGWVVDGGTGDLQSRCDFLNSFISPAEDYVLEYKNKKIQFRPDSSIAYSSEYKKNNDKVRRFLIQGTCPHPLFTDMAETAVPFEKTGKMFHFPTDWGREKPLVLAVVGKSYNVTVNNKGGFTTGITAQLRFLGEVTNPRLWNMTTGEFVGVNRTFARGERLEIATTPGSKHMTLHKADGQTENLIKYRDYQMNWFQLRPGQNLIAIECADPDQRSNMDVTLMYTPLYLEVE